MYPHGCLSLGIKSSNQAHIHHSIPPITPPMSPLLPLIRPVAGWRAIFLAQQKPALSSVFVRYYTSGDKGNRRSNLLRQWRQWGKWGQESDDQAHPPQAEIVESNQDAVPNITEEAGQTREIMGEEGFDMANVKSAEEVFQHDSNAFSQAPEVIKQDLQHPQHDYAPQDPIYGHQQQQDHQFHPYDDTFSNFVPPQSGMEDSISSHPPPPQLPTFPDDPNAATAFSSAILTERYNYPKIFHPPPTPHHIDPDKPVSKFPLPTLPLPSTSHLRHRYSPLIDQVVNLFMQDGKKATAQTNLQIVLDILRTKPSPKEQTKWNLIADAPPLDQLPKNPLAYLRTAIDSVAPLMRLKTVKGSGGFTNQVPEPLNERQRRRTAVMWMLKAADGKRDRLRFAERFAEEVVAVVEGRSSAWDRRLQVHKTAVGARANVKVKL